MGVFIKKSLPYQHLEGSEEANFSLQLDVVPYEKDGTSTHRVLPILKDMRKVEPLPTSQEYDLAQQLKAGVHPNEINVHGILPSDDGYFNPVQAFNSLQEQIDSIKENDVKSEN